jgi:hypothetical protein
MKKCKRLLFLGIILLFAQCGYGQSKITERCPCAYPGIHFNNKDRILSVESKKILEIVANHLRANPEGRVFIKVSSGPSKKDQQLCDVRIKNLHKYFLEKQGIMNDRVIALSDMDNGPVGSVAMSCIMD